MSIRRRKTLGVFIMIAGLILLVPPAAVFYLNLFYYTVSWDPKWIPMLMIALTATGGVLVATALTILLVPHRSRAPS